MTKRQNPNPEFDLFIPLMGDLPLKDQRETMERPFFSLQKRKRVKPIEGSVAKIVKLEHAWRRLDGRNDDGFQVAPFPG